MARSVQIPRKASYRLHEVCKHADIQPYVLRFWESEFPQLRPNRSRGGQAVYSRKDIDLILQIKRLLDDESFSLDAAREQLDREAGGGKSSGGEEPAADSGGRGATASAKVDASVQGNGASGSATRKPPAVVRKQRYDDAVEEIANLRLLLKDVEAKLRQVEQELEETKNSEARHRDRNRTAAARLESLLERFS